LFCRNNFLFSYFQKRQKSYGNSVANNEHLDRSIFATARKEMLYDNIIYLILSKEIKINSYLSTGILNRAEAEIDRPNRYLVG
jgi:hypothetical protein